jgi:hypothetical protein
MNLAHGELRDRTQERFHGEEPDSRGHFGCVEHYRGLFDIDAGEYLGRATAAQIAASDSAGETGAILIDTETGEVLRSDYCRVTYPDVACVYVD